MALSFLASSWLSTLQLVSSISTGMTASFSYVSRNGVSPVGVLAVVLYAHSMLGNSSGHMPFAPSSRVLMILSRDRFVTSTCLLACGWAGEEQWFLILNCEQKSQNELLSNYFPLSETKTLGMPNLHMMHLQTKLCMFFFVIVARASASTHFVKQSMPTTRNFSYQIVVGNVPIMSSPHWANGQGAVIGVNSSVGCRIMLLNL